MAKSRDLLDKLSKLVEQGITNYKDLSSEIINICQTKRNDFIFKMKLTSKEETEIIKKRLEKIEKSSRRLKREKNLKR